MLDRTMTPADLAQVSRVRELAENGGAREIRESRKISVREAAGAMSVAPSTLTRWETGAARPKLTGALRWAKLLDALGEGQ